MFMGPLTRDSFKNIGRWLQNIRDVAGADIARS
jgi:hypothetical protein